MERLTHRKLIFKVGNLYKVLRFGNLYNPKSRFVWYILAGAVVLGTAWRKQANYLSACSGAEIDTKITIMPGLTRLEYSQITRNKKARGEVPDILPWLGKVCNVC